MSLNGWIGIAEIARKIKKIDIGIDNIARKVKGVWIGDENGIARKSIVLGITAPSNLRVNGSTSSTGSSCRLTWTAATITGATGITYYIYKNGVQAAATTSTSYTFSTGTISGWSRASLTVKAYNAATGYSEASNAVTFTYKAASAKVTVNASKYADTYNSSYANTGTTTSIVGRSTSDAPVGTALQFLAPSGGWSQYSKAVLYVQRTGGSASGNVRVHKLTNAYSGSISALQAYYGNVGTSIGTVAVAGGTGWFSIDVSSYIPSSGEFAVTLVCRDSYMTVDGTTAYIQLTA